MLSPILMSPSTAHLVVVAVVSAVVVVSAVAVILVSAPVLPLVLPSPFLFLSPAPALPPLPSLGFLWPLALPHAPLPPAPATDTPVRTKMLAIGQAGLRHAGGGRHKPPPVLAPAPTVSPSAFSAGIAALARSIRQDRGGSGQGPGATAAPLDQLAYPSARWLTYRKTYTNPL